MKSCFPFQESSFFLKVRDVIGQKESEFALIAVRACEVMKVCFVNRMTFL